MRIASPKERRLATILTKIGETCENLNLSKNVLETSSMIYRSLDGRIDVKGKSIVGITAATIYMACKQCEVIRTLDEICREICPPKSVKTKTKLAARYYRTMVMEMGALHAPVVVMSKYISKIANVTETEVRVERLALEIADKTKDGNISDGKGAKRNGSCVPVHSISTAWTKHPAKGCFKRCRSHRSHYQK